MRLRLALSLALLLLNGALLHAAETAINGTTILRFEQRSLPGFNKQTLVPATQFLSLETSGVADPNLSVHIYGWGRADIAEKSTDKSSDGALTYGYLRYYFPKSNAEIRAGRLFVFEGVSAENLDGIYGRTDLAKGLTLAVFGGAPVHPASSVDNRGDYLTGGRLSYSYPSLLEIGISSLYEKGLISGPLSNLRDTRQLVGGDLWLRPHRIADLKGRLSYDTVNSGLAEQSWLLAVKTGDNATLALDYGQHDFKNYFAAASIRSLFNPDTAGREKAAGVSYNMQVSKPLELTASYRHFDRNTTGNSDRFGVEGRLSLLESKGMSGLSYFRVNAPSGVNSFHETRAFFLYNAASYSASIDGIVQIYDDRINGKKDGFQIQGSAGYRLKQNLNLSCDLSYGQNPAYTSEFKGLVRLTFNYNTAKGSGK